MVARFAEQQALWNGAVAAMAELDALMALAAAAEQAAAWGPVCRPTFVQPSAGGGQVWCLLRPSIQSNLSSLSSMEDAIFCVAC